MELEKALLHYFGYESFREGQKEIITSLMDGVDVIAMLPTGTGKSICYQLPAILSEGVTIIVSPLLSLMEDQVQQLRSEGIKDVVAINSFMNREDREIVLQQLHTYKMIYLSPEMLQSPFVLSKIKKLKITYFVVDEAHCISQWGHDFRPDYLRLDAVLHTLGRPTCLAITATATTEVQQDISKQLALRNPNYYIYSVDRPTISYQVEKCQNAQEKIERIKDLVQNLQGPGMIYFSSRMWAENISNLLKQAGVKRVAYYHGGLSTEDRLLLQQQFMSGQIELICCTSAFGMGINKKDIRYVIHFHYPIDLESYVQEIGRAARDGNSAAAILLYCEEDQGLVNMLLERELLTDEQLYQLLAHLQKHSELEDNKEQELVQFMQINEVSWRTIRYQLETRGVLKKHRVYPFSMDSLFESIRQEEQERMQNKQKNLASFLRWIRTKTCRREKLLLYFNEQLEKHPSNCCDNCGANLTNFKRAVGREDSPVLIPWREALSDLFRQNEMRNNEKTT